MAARSLRKIRNAFSFCTLTIYKAQPITYSNIFNKFGSIRTASFINIFCCNESSDMLFEVNNHSKKNPFSKYFQYFRRRYATLAAKHRVKPLITLFTKEDCSLCDVAKDVLVKFKDRCDIEEVDIGKDENAAWFEQYQYDIPVLHLNSKFLMKHKIFVNVLEDALVTLETAAAARKTKSPDELTLFFSGNFLDRCGQVRKHSHEMQSRMQKETSKFIVFKNLDPLTYKPENCKHLKLKVISFRDIQAIYPEYKEFSNEIVFLGTNKEVNGESNWFAFNLTNKDTEAKLFNFVQKDSPTFTRSFPGMLKLNEMESSLAAQSRGLLAWHKSHKFCPACGSKTSMSEGGYKRVCNNNKCGTKQVKAHQISYPRVDPVTMVLVVSPDSKSILLGRQHTFPRGFFSCLAGFIEPGESLESAVKREVYEECNIHVDKVEYKLSQFWPFPSSLMFGCIATANDTNILLDSEELEEAFWISNLEAEHMISSKTMKAYNSGEDVRIAPPKQSLAHQLIKYWLEHR